MDRRGFLDCNPIRSALEKQNSNWREDVEKLKKELEKIKEKEEEDRRKKEKIANIVDYLKK